MKINFVNIVLLSLFLAGCEGEELNPQKAFLPYAHPYQKDMDAAILESMHAVIENGAYGNINGLIIIKDESIVYEKYYNGYTGDNEIFLGEATKGVFMLGLHHMLEAGSGITNDSEINDLFTSYSDLFFNQPFKDEITIDQLISHQSGLEWYEWQVQSDEESDLNKMLLSDDFTEYVLSKGLLSEPGTVFNYNSGHLFLLERIMAEHSGITVPEYFEQNIFGKLNIQQFSWNNINDSVTNVLDGLSMYPMDWAKLGYVVLQSGKYKGVQVLPEDVLIELSQRDGSSNYYEIGREWWKLVSNVNVVSGLAYNDLMFIRGASGQYLMLVPYLNLEVVFMANLDANDVEVPLVILRDYILNAISPNEI